MNKIRLNDRQDGRSSMHFAAGYAKEEVVRCLMNHKALLNEGGGVGGWGGVFERMGG